MNARDDVLATVRRSLGVTGSEAPRRAVVAERLGRHPSGVIPARAASKDPAGVIRLFVEMAEASAATVATVTRAEDAPAAVADYLRGRNLALRLRRGDDPRLAGLDWEAASIETTVGRSFGDDETGASFAFGAVAETGTLALLSGRENPTTLNFLPDTHVVLVHAADVAATYEDVWARVRNRFGAGAMPRTVNLVTGPSRSADIEQILLMGAHGPRRLYIVLIDPTHQSEGADAVEAAPAGSTPSATEVRSTLGGEKTPEDEPKPVERDPKTDEDDAKKDDDLDEELEESFPASDPPASTQP